MVGVGAWKCSGGGTETLSATFPRSLGLTDPRGDTVPHVGFLSPSAADPEI